MVEEEPQMLHYMKKIIVDKRRTIKVLLQGGAAR